MQVRVALRSSAAPFTAGEAVESERFEFPGTQGLSAPNVLCAMIPPGARGVHGQHLVLHIAAQKRSIITELAHTSKAQVKPKPTAREHQRVIAFCCCCKGPRAIEPTKDQNSRGYAGAEAHAGSPP